MRFHRLPLILLALAILAGVFAADARITARRPKPKKPKKVYSMDLTLNLVAYFDMAQNPDMGQMWDRVGGNHLNVIGSPTLVDGVAGGQGLQCLGTSQGLYRSSAPGLSHLAEPFTFAIWYTPTAPLDGSGQTRIIDCSEYAIILFLSPFDGKIYFAHELENNDTVVADTLPVVVGQRYLVIIGFDGLHAFINVNLVHSKESVPAGITPSITDFDIGNNGIAALPHLDGIVDEAAFWRGRVLTYSEIAYLYNNGGGRSYDELNPQACDREIECCPPDPYEYQSAAATDSEAGSNFECVEVLVEASPASGAYVFFPTYVVLSADHPDAIIRYTTDGTEPTATSTQYTEPFQVTESGTVIQARAFLGNCSPGPIIAVVYQNPPFPIGLAYACDTPDNGGSFGIFAPNGTVDNHWQIQFTLSALTTIKRLEMYQTNGSGSWNTGIVWSTDSPITAIDGASRDVMPLLVFIAAVQQWVAYQTSLGAFGAGTHTWDLYGDRWQPAGGFFRLDVILADDSRISSIVNSTCTGVLPPTPCPSPAAPTTTALCDGEVDVTFVGSIAQNYKVWVSQVGSPGGWTLAASGSMAASPTTVNVTGLTKGALYYFRVELEYAGCGFQSSINIPGIPLPDPSVLIASSSLEVNPGESFTISWNSNHIGGAVCGGCLDGQVSLNQGLGCKAGNAEGSQATSQATPGDYTYTITGCNTCGTEIASVVVTVRNVAVCSVQPSILSVDDPTSFLCGLTGSCTVLPFLFDIPWNGDIPRTSDCLWSVCATGGCESSPGSGAYMSFCVWCSFSVNKWLLQVGTTGSANGFYWQGEKLFGTSPLGIYTRVSGCATGPSSITVS
jgi:hypothetical protein